MLHFGERRRRLLRGAAALLLALLLLVGVFPAGQQFTAVADAPAPTLRVAYYNLSYSSETYVMYAVAYENLNPDTAEVRMLFWDSGRTDGYELGTEDRSVTASGKATINGVKHLVFYSKGLAPKELTDTIYCRAYVAVGGESYYSEPIKYSPIKYITDVLEKPDSTEADRNLVSALRAYGAAAQERFAYHTERLASETFCKLTLNGAHLDDGFSYGIYKEGTELTVTADVPDGSRLEKWVDDEGTVLGTDGTLTLTLQKDRTVSAVVRPVPDFSADVGRTFSAGSKELIPYFFTGGSLTIAATVQLSTGVSGRGGVIVGNYNYGSKQTLNLEIYTGGQPRLYFEREDSSYSIMFDTDIRSDSPRRIAITIGEKGGACALYVDGQLAETKQMPCQMPAILDTLRLGGDYRSGNGQYFKGRLYALAIYEGVRSASELAGDVVFGAELDSPALAVSYRFRTADVRTDDGPCGKDLTAERSGLSPQALSDRYSLQDTFSQVPLTYEALIETSADVSNSKGCTIIGNYNTAYMPGISFRVYLNGRPSLCLRYDRDHQDQFTFPTSILGEGRVHAAITIDDTYVYGYLNGSLVLKKAHCGYMPDLTQDPFSVGGDNRSDNSWWFRDGNIFSINLFSGYRTAEQIKRDVNRVDPDDPTLMLSYDFEQSQTDRGPLHNEIYPYYYDRDFLPSDSYDYTFACVGDTQSLVKKYPDELHNIYDFLLDHVDDMKIDRVIGLGDMTEDNTAEQWELVSEQVYRLDGVVPYTVIRGNHDHFARTEEAVATKELMFGYYFDNATYRQQYDDSYDGGPTNTYTRFAVCGVPYLLLNLDYCPDDGVLAWASGVCEQYPTDNVIVATHGFLLQDGTTIDETDSVCVNTCKQMWEKFVSQEENIVLVLCGHDPSCNIVVSRMTGVHGNLVTCLLIDPQHIDFYERAAGLVTLLHFSNGGRTITVENYSTVVGKFYKISNETVIENVARLP